MKVDSMGDFVFIPGLTVTVPDHNVLITIQNPTEVLARNPELDVLCVPIKEIVAEKQEPIKPPEDQQATKETLETNRDIATAETPVKLGSRLEGFKFDGKWLYHNSNPRKTRFCTNWRTIGDKQGIKELDAIYLETMAEQRRDGKEGQNERFKQ